MKGSLGSLQAAVAQLKTAVVALELRPPLGDAAAGSADCLQVGAGWARADHGRRPPCKHTHWRAGYGVAQAAAAA